MLARKYDNAVWQEPQYQIEEVQIQRQVKQANRNKLLRRRCLTIVAMILATYMVTVWRSSDLVQYRNILLGLQRQETKLLNKNDELKIEVEQLKGPERIIGFAEKKLGMNVARSNIYVKASAAKNTAAPYTLAKK